MLQYLLDILDIYRIYIRHNLSWIFIPILFVIFLIICNPAIRDFYLIYLDRFAMSKASTYLNSVTVGKKIWHGKNGWDEMPESTEATVCITSPFIYARPFVVFHFKVHLSSSREQSGRIEIKKSIDTFFPRVVYFTMKI